MLEYQIFIYDNLEYAFYLRQNDLLYVEDTIHLKNFDLLKQNNKSAFPFMFCIKQKF